jgi:hypothetical protein
VRGGGSSCSTEVTFNRLVQLIRLSRRRRRSVHGPVRVAGGDQLGQLACMGDLPGMAGPPQPRQHRQTHRARQKRQLHDDACDDPAVAEPDRFRALRRTVMMPRHAEHFLTGSLEQRVVDCDGQRRSGRQEMGHDEVSQRQSHGVARPAGHGEESVRAAVMPELLQAGSGEHPADRSAASLTDQTNNKADERAESWSGKAGPEHGEEVGQ